jgi:hypothetical protein
MSERIRAFTPRLSREVMADDHTTLEQQRAFVEVLIAAVGAGLSNVVTLTLDDLGTVYSGLYEFDVHLHEVGHNKDTKGVPALDVRAKLRAHHLTLVDRLVQGLKQLPEGNGSVFDNTVILYFPENGETHHSVGSEVPFVIVAGDNARVRTSGRYIRLPGYNQPGHKTLGNFYTSLLNAYGNPIKHYGDLDPGLKMEQTGPIPSLVA